VLEGAAALTGRMRIARLQLGGTLDRYIATLFVGAYATSLLLVVGLAVIIDVASNLNYFQPWKNGESASTALIVHYYALNVPFLYLQVAPFVTASAALFTVSKLVKHNELVSGLNAGLSTQRILLPLFAGGALAAAFMFGVRETVTAALGDQRDALHELLDNQRTDRVFKAVWFRDIVGNIVRFDVFRPVQAGLDSDQGEGFEVAVQKGPTVTVVSATRASWTGSDWKLVDGMLREETGDTSKQRAVDTLGDVLRFTPRDVMLAIKGFERPLELSFTEIGELLRRDPDNREYQTLLQYNITFPLANLVLLLVALPFLVGRERGKSLEGLVIASLMCVMYFAGDFVSRSFGMEGSLTPLLATWLPVLFFGSLGAVLFEGLRT
jgi:lipopolysaccharide export system permease protein